MTDTAYTESANYRSRVYAGVLGKIIGVYLGRPFESWTYERIIKELGEVRYYVNDRLNVPLIVTDDDISGTFTFLRAMPDYGNPVGLTPAQIGQTWLNYIIEGRTTLWWGGHGNSTEHTAYLALKAGIAPPASGSAQLNGRIVSEQIGAQIFIDGWGMIAPGDPEFAADLAQRAASVSHDGVAIHAAQVVAAMEAAAFIEADLTRVIDSAVSLIPSDSVIARLVDDVREWHSTYDNWRTARKLIAQRYGYDRYFGNCHVVPNHALIILALLFGHGDFRESLTIVNTSGWDTDCNSGNVGCLLGIKGGLDGIDSGIDWRGPLADRLFLPSADGGRAITDALTEADRIVNIGRALNGVSPVVAKRGARFHFDLPGAVQGWVADGTTGTTRVDNIAGHSAEGERSLAIRFVDLRPGVSSRVRTATFIPEYALKMPGYGLEASPSLYSGQLVRALVKADQNNHASVECQLFICTYASVDPTRIYGPGITLAPGEAAHLRWSVPGTGGNPIVYIGLELNSDVLASGLVYLDYLTWDGEPNIVLGKPDGQADIWPRGWVNAVDHLDVQGPQPYRIVQNEGTGLLIQGSREWRNYVVSASITTQNAGAAGIAARVQGLRRYYGLLLCERSKVRLVKVLDEYRVLDEANWVIDPFAVYQLRIEVDRQAVKGWVDDHLLFDVKGAEDELASGAVALICKDGAMTSGAVTVRPVRRENSVAPSDGA